MPKYPISIIMNERINNTFTYHKPISDQPERYELIRNAARNLAFVIVENSPTSREQSIALTALEEVIFNVNAAIARNEKEAI